MGLKFTVTEEEYGAFDDATKKLYVLGDTGDYRLDTEGDAPGIADLKAKVADFRKNNLRLTKEKKTLEDSVAERDTQLAAFEGIDPEKHKALQTELDALKAKGDGTADSVKALIDQHTAPLTKRLEKMQQALDKSETEKKEVATRARRERFNSVIGDTAKENGVRAEAMQDIRQRATAAGWKISEEDDELRLYDGEEVVTDDRGDPKTLKSWLQDLQKNGGGFLFESTQGTDTRPGGGRPGAGPTNPKVVNNPSDAFFQANMEKIQSGEIIVTRT